MAAAAGSQTVRGQSSANTALPKAAMKTNKPSPTKNDGIGKEAQLSTPKVVDLMITGQWRVSGKDGEDAEPDDEDSGQAEVAIFAKVSKRVANRYLELGLIGNITTGNPSARGSS